MPTYPPTSTPPPPSFSTTSPEDVFSRASAITGRQPAFGGGGGGDLPPRQSNEGSDIYFVTPGDSWGSIALRIYGDERYKVDLQGSNPGRQVLHPGMTLVLPDRVEDPRVPTLEREDFWNTDAFADTVNAAEETRQILPIWRHAEQKWPEYGNIVFLGFDENNDPYPTTDPTGMPLFWDPKQQTWSIEDTGISYTMGMIENDFIKPLTLQERQDLYIMGVEQKLQGIELGAYDAGGTQMWQDSITRNLPQDTAFVPTLHDVPQPTPLKLAWWESAFDALRLLEEPVRGLANVTTRESEEGRPGISHMELAWAGITSLGKVFVTGLGYEYANMREVGAGIFGQEIKPYGVDKDTNTKYTEDEIDTLIASGRADEITWVTPPDYWRGEFDRSMETMLAIYSRGGLSGRVGDMGIYRDTFDSDEEFDAYVQGIFNAEPGLQQEALARSNRDRDRMEETRKEALHEKSNLESQAHAALAEGKGGLAVSLMTEAKQLELRAAHWYSPFFMWSRLDEPWREEAFLKAVAIAELENMGPLDPRVIRTIRDNYEHAGVNLAMGIAFDISNFMGIGTGKKILSEVGGGISDLFRLGGRAVRSTGVLETKPIRTVLDFFFAEAHSSVAGVYKRNASNLIQKLAQGTEQTLTGPIGTTRGLDQMIEVLASAAKGNPDAIAELPASVTRRWQVLARGLQDLYNPNMSEAWMQRINPDNWGQLIDDAYNIIFQRSYDRAIRDTIRDFPNLPVAQQVSKAKAIAEEIASKPRLVAGEFAQNFETVYRRLHETKLGPETLDDNPIWQFMKRIGVNMEGDMELGRGAFKLFYGFRNHLFEWWLGLRPGWTAINYLDSTVRFLLSGGKLYDDMGTLHSINTRRLLGRNLLREEFKTAFSRAIHELEGELDYVEPIVERALQGQRFKYGPLSLLTDARRQIIAEKRAVRQARSATDNLLQKILRWSWDQVGMTKNILARGAVNTNALIEFGLRTRLSIQKFDSVFWTMDQFNLEKIVDDMVQLGATPDTISAFRKAWLASADDVEKAAEFMNILGGSGRRSERLFSQILPDNWEDILQKNGVDRRMRALIFRPIVEDIEDVLRKVKPEGRVQAVTEYVDEAIYKINSELVDRSNDPALRSLADDMRPGGTAGTTRPIPGVVEPVVIDRTRSGAVRVGDDWWRPVKDGEVFEPGHEFRMGLGDGEQTWVKMTPEEARDAVRTRGSGGVRLGVQEGEVRLGLEGEELTVTTEQMRVGKKIVYTMSEDYYRLGELQRESTARLFDAERQISEAIDTAAGTAEALAKGTQNLAVAKALLHHDAQLRLIRDNVKKFFLRVFPGPLRLDPGPLRAAAWEHFDRLGQQVYEAIITFNDEAIEAALRGEIVEVPGLRDILFKAGVDLDFENGALRAIRLTDAGAGTRVSFSSWRGTVYLRKHLIQSFFGRNVTIKNAEAAFNAAFTAQHVASTSAAQTTADVAKVVAKEFGENAGQVIDDATQHADNLWEAFATQADDGGESLRSRWGAEATQTRQGFIDFLEQEVARLSGLSDQLFVQGEALGRYASGYMSRSQIETRLAQITSEIFDMPAGSSELQWARAEQGALNDALRRGITEAAAPPVHQDTIGALRRLQDEARALAVSIDIATLPPELVGHAAGPIPRWMLSDGIQSWLRITNDITAQRSALTRSLEELKQGIVKGLADGTMDFANIPADQRTLIRGILDEAIWRKGAAHDVAMDGTKAIADVNPGRLEELSAMTNAATGTDTFEGAVKFTQDRMLEYGRNYRIDNMIKSVSPFWMFQSRGPIFWIKAFAQHPEYLAWWSRYQRTQRKHQIDNGATDSAGRPLRSLYGYFRLPGTDLWFNPIYFSSGKYVLPRPSPYAGEFPDNIGPYEEALNYAYEYGQMFGFRPAPWIQFLLIQGGMLDTQRYPVGSLISQVDVVVPPWIQRDIRRALRQSRYPGDPGLFTEDVGWMDFLVEQEIYMRALQELTENPDNLAKVQSEIYNALGFVVTGYDEFGAPTFDKEHITRNRENPRWIAARDHIEQTQYYSQLLGFFTGIYPKEFSDAEAQLMAVRDNLNFLKDSINNVTGTAIFQLDPVPETRMEIYQNMKWETPEGWVSQLYGASRWVETQGGGQAYGQERIELMAQRIHENEVTQAYYDSLALAHDQLNECQLSGGIGSDSAVRRTCFKNYFRTRKALDDHPAYAVAQRDWIVGYKTEKTIADNFERMWWSYIDATMPKWYVEDEEPYDSWVARVEAWKEDLPGVGTDLAGAFLVHEVAGRAGFEDGENPLEIPGHRIIVPEAVVKGLLKQTNAEGYDAYRLKNDTAFEAMNNAFKALQWDPYMAKQKEWESLNSYEQETAEQEWLEKAKGLGLPELQRWILENYPEGKFTPAQLAEVFGATSLKTIEERNLPNSERGVVESEVWEMLAAIGPGENFDVFKEAFVKAGGETDSITAWYETGGGFEDYAKLQELHGIVKKTAEAMGVGTPTQAQLVEWGAAKRLNDDFWKGITNTFGEDFRHLLAVYGVLSGADKKAYRKDNPEIDEYYDMRDAYGEDNQLWAKYYNPEAYTTQTGLAGEGAEKRGTSGGGGGGGGRRQTSFSGGGGGSFTPRETMVGQGYRSTYDTNRLADPRILGSGGVAGSPFWPAGFGKGTPKGVLNEIVDLKAEGKPLSGPALAYLGAVKAGEWAAYIAELIAESQKAATKGGGGGVVTKV